MACSLKELQDDLDGTGGPCGSGGAGVDCDVEGHSQNRRSLHLNRSKLARPCRGQENAWGVLHGTPTEMTVLTTPETNA